MTNPIDALRGLDIPEANLTKLLSVDVPGWTAEVPQINAFFDDFGERLPAELREEAAKRAARSMRLQAEPLPLQIQSLS